jgi:hypothetical protein
MEGLDKDLQALQETDINIEPADDEQLINDAVNEAEGAADAEDDVVSLKAALQESQQQIQQLTRVVSQMAAGQNPAIAEAEPAIAEPSYVEKDFFVGSALSEHFEPEILEALNQVMNNAVKESIVESYQFSMQSIPKHVQNSVTSYNEVNQSVQEFWNSNKDLLQGASSKEDVKHIKNLVSFNANQIASEHPEYSFEQVMDKTAEITRRLLGRKSGKPQQKGKPPIFPPKPGAGINLGSNSAAQVPKTPTQRDLNAKMFNIKL